MARRGSESLFERIYRLSRAAKAPQDVLIPVDDVPVYQVLASEIARASASDSGQALTAIFDGQTAAMVDAVEAVCAAAKHVFVFGHPPAAWPSAEKQTSCVFTPEVTERDRFLVVLSSDLNLAVLGRVWRDGTGGERTFHGGWTGLRSLVKQTAEILLTSSGCQQAEVLSLPEEAEKLERVSAACSRFMGLLTQRIASLQRDISMDKHDLFSVLEILKAISARRRAHDILFVFVEQIARVIDLDRCSVVRVWGGDDRGHVLASHEDETVNDLIIELKKYPELGRAMEARELVVINDVGRDPLTRDFADQLRQARISSLMVVPIVLFDQNVGSLLLRAARGGGPFTPREISFCEIVAEAAANALERAHLFDSIQKANERLEYLAVTDGLTGLYNHRYFRERLEEELQRARRYSIPLSCLFLDVDEFKRVNDSFGHLQGDQVLREMAALTLQTVRKSDIVVRYGGEEFVVVMPQTSAEGGRAEAERLREELSAHPYSGMPDGYPISVSIGVGVLDHDSMLDCEALIRAADSALYEAKRRGGNNVVVAAPRGEMS